MPVTHDTPGIKPGGRMRVEEAEEKRRGRRKREGEEVEEKGRRRSRVKGKDQLTVDPAKWYPYP